MTKKLYYFILIFSLELAIIIPLATELLPRKNQAIYISVNAQKFGYSPSRIIVKKGDTINLKFSSSDVTHGFLLDGYPIDLMAKKGTLFRNHSSHDDHSDPLKKNWSRVSSVKFTASKPGKFIFRCSKTCGNLHPFMTGELIVTPNIPYYLSVSISIWLTFFILFTGYFKASPAKKPFRIDLMEKIPIIKKLVKFRNLQLFFILFNLIVFYVFILSSLTGSPVGNRNIAIVFVWILWWFLLKAVMVPFGGRIWCFMCPLPAPAEWLSRKRIATVKFVRTRFKTLHHRFLGMERDWPKPLRNIWLQNILFLILISFGMILITRPIATAVVFLLILGVTLICALIFRQRVFCLYLCPVGGFLGTYSMAAMTEIRSIDKDVCKKHRTKSCLIGSSEGWACPWNQYIGNMKRNTDCGLCTECIKSCSMDNIGIFIRPFGSDRIIKGYDEVFNIIIMLVVAIVFSTVMLGPWGTIKDAAIMINYGYVISILSDPLGLGWDIFNLANSHFKPFIPEWIPIIQGVILLTGLYFGLKRGYQSLHEVIENKKQVTIAILLPAIYALACTNILLRIFI